MKLKKYSIKNIRKNRSITSWVTLILDPFSSGLTWLIIHFSHLNPNIITLIGLVIGFSASYFIYNDMLWISALLFEIYYIFDMTDGRVARLTNKTTKKGALFDFFGDRVLYFILATFLFLYSIDKNGSKQIFIVIILFVFLENFNLLSTQKINQIDQEKKSSKKMNKKKINIIYKIIKKYQHIKNKYKIPIIPGGVEAVHAVFFLGPITGKIFFGFLIGDLILLFCFLTNFLFLSIRPS